MPINILVSSISKKIPLIKAVQLALQKVDPAGKVYGADADSSCIGQYFVEKFFKIAPQNKLTIQAIIRLCKKNHINIIIPTRDGELPFFAKHQKRLEQNGIHVMTSSPETIKKCNDKWLFYQFLKENSFPTIPTTTTLKDLGQGSFVVKEREGAGAETIALNLNKKEAAEWGKKLHSPLYQHYIEGTEYSVDVYVNKEGKAHGAVARTRDLIVHGESQITTSVKDKKIEKLCIEMAEQLDIRGHAVFQLIRNKSGKLFPIECNPRFGGASTLSLAMGLHSFKWFLLEVQNKKLPGFLRAKEEKVQVRYPSDLILK